MTVTLCEFGHDISGTTATRPTNADLGCRYYNTTLGCFQVFNGTAWENVGLVEPIAAVVAAGSVQGDATALTAGALNVVTAGDGTVGVILPTAVAEVALRVYNSSASILKVYPNTSDNINGGSNNASVNVAAHTLATFIATDATIWAGNYTAGGTNATLTGSETLTNKTLTSPIVNTPTTTRKGTAKTVDYTVVAATDSGQTFTNTGAGGAVVFALPAATVGQNYRFAVGAAQALRIDPNGTETISLPSTGVPGAAGKYLGCSTVGCSVEVECTLAGTWNVFGFTGTWVAEG